MSSYYFASYYFTASVKFRLVLPFWYQLTWVDKGPLNGCVRVLFRKSCSCHSSQPVHSIFFSFMYNRFLCGHCSTVTVSSKEGQKLAVVRWWWWCSVSTAQEWHLAIQKLYRNHPIGFGGVVSRPTFTRIMADEPETVSKWFISLVNCCPRLFGTRIVKLLMVENARSWIIITHYCCWTFSCLIVRWITWSVSSDVCVEYLA